MVIGLHHWFASFLAGFLVKQCQILRLYFYSFSNVGTFCFRNCTCFQAPFLQHFPTVETFLKPCSPRICLSAICRRCWAVWSHPWSHLHVHLGTFHAHGRRTWFQPRSSEVCGEAAPDWTRLLVILSILKWKGWPLWTTRLKRMWFGRRETSWRNLRRWVKWQHQRIRVSGLCHFKFLFFGSHPVPVDWFNKITPIWLIQFAFLLSFSTSRIHLLDFILFLSISFLQVKSEWFRQSNLVLSTPPAGR